MNRRDLLTALAATSAITLPAMPLSALTSTDFPWEKRRMAVLGHDMAFVDTGTGDPVVMLHGNPTSSFLWRGVIPHLEGTHRVIAPDLIGMGNSAKPTDLAYTYADHAAHLHGLLDALDLQNVTLVIHDWGGALGFDWAMQNPGRVKAIAFMETIAPPVMPFESYEAMGPFGELFKAWRTPGTGEQMILEDNMFINEILGKQAVLTPLSDEVLTVYNSYYPDAASRAPLLAWPREVPIGGAPAETVGLTHRIAGFLTTSEIPKLLFNVTPGGITPEPAVQWMQANVPALTTVHLGPGVHFIQEDYPDEIGQGIADWLKTL